MDRNESVDARESREFAMGELWLPMKDRVVAREADFSGGVGPV